MKSKQIRMITHGAILAALYVALTYLQNWLLPGTTSAAIQFRASEALCIFALFTPAAIPGLTVGCLLFNISNAGALPLDWLVGTGATLLATTCIKDACAKFIFDDCFWLCYLLPVKTELQDSFDKLCFQTVLNIIVNMPAIGRQIFNPRCVMP